MRALYILVPNSECRLAPLSKLLARKVMLQGYHLISWLKLKRREYEKKCFVLIALALGLELTTL
jgi:hypothetical protein